MRRFVGLITLFVLLIGGTLGVGALAGAGAALWVTRSQVSPAPDVLAQGAADEPSIRAAADAPEPGDTVADDAFLEAVRATRPAVVTVWSLRRVQRSPFAPPRMEAVGSGSGVVFDERGYIATNHHVIAGAEALEVLLLDGRRVPASVVASDESYDVAVLSVDPSVALPASAPLADSAQLEPGMRVLAIGSPLGTDYQNTVTTGIIAGLNRRLTRTVFDLRTFRADEVEVNRAPLIQTDAAINSGNSGGPLVDLDGKVVGLNTVIVRSDGQTPVEGLGFAVPSNVVRALADEWIDGISRGWLGVNFATIDAELAREQGLDRAAGALVMQIYAGSAADEAGLRAGDVLTAIDGTALDLDHALEDQLWRYRAGDTIRLTVERDGQPREIEVTLGDTPGGT